MIRPDFFTRLDPFWQLYDGLSLQLGKLADKAFDLFQHDPFHPSLHFKEINKRRGVWSARINADYRILGFREGSQMTWFWIGPHTEYEKIVARL